MATDCGAGHVGCLVDRGAPGDGVDELRLAHQAGEERAGSGAGEGAAEANAEQHGVDGPDAANGAGAAEREAQQNAAAEGLKGVAGEDDAAAVVAIGDVARGEHEEQPGKEQREAGVAEIERGVRDLVDLPRHGHRLCLGPEDHEQTRRLVEAEVAREQRGCGGSLLFGRLVERGGLPVSHDFYACTSRRRAKGAI